MDRRTFLHLLGLGAGSLTANEVMARWIGSWEEAGPASAYGSGHFGEWITDAYGLPAYRYTCDQTRDPSATSPVHAAWRGPNDHTHQVGNGRILAAASNFGYVQVRQDEGAPKFLNDYDPASQAYGGGLGFLEGPGEQLSTWYSGAPAAPGSFDRVFGVGYYRKTVRGRLYSADQVILAPFGDDPVLLSGVSLTNHSATPAFLRWVEYWGAAMYQFSCRSWMEASLNGNPQQAAALRRAFARRFRHTSTLLPDGSGLRHGQHFRGRLPEEEEAWAAVEAAQRTHPEGGFGPPRASANPRAQMEDLAPPDTFLLALDGGSPRYADDAATFFGTAGPGAPPGLAEPLPNRLSTDPRAPALLLEQHCELQPGESRTLSFLYGYLPAGFSLEELRAKYRGPARKHLARSGAAWRADGLRFSVPALPWVERETTWSHYYLRSGGTFDSYFGEQILSQGQIYQYVLGWQAAARDPLQHALPLLFSNPEQVRSVLRYTAKTFAEHGELPYGIVGAGVPLPSAFQPSDSELWLLWVGSEYVLATRDRAFLLEPLRLPVLPGDEAPSHAQAKAETMRSILARCFTRVTETIGAGEHGLMRLLKGDWNDDIVVGHVPPEEAAEVRAQGESVLNAAMAAFVLPRYAALLEYCGAPPEEAAAARGWAAKQRAAVEACWTGRWFRRAWLGPHLGWIGEDHLWLEPQPWAMLAGVGTAEQRARLVAELDYRLRAPSPIGASMQSAEDPAMQTPPGTMTNGGVWSSLNGPLVAALAEEHPAMAWDEWQKNTLARHAESYGEMWYGIWSGPDNYNSTQSRHPGGTMFAEPALIGLKTQPDWGFNWTDFPVMNLHAHAWTLYSAALLPGLRFEPRGFSLRLDGAPAECAFRSPLFGFLRGAAGWEGWYAPAAAGLWRVELRYGGALRGRLGRLWVNGVVTTPALVEGGLVFEGVSATQSPLRWRVVLDSQPL